MITEHQRKQRCRFLGSSDIAALFTGTDGKSLDPFKTATDVWASKVYPLKESDGTPAISRGNRYEKPLIQYAESQLGCKIITARNRTRFICKEHPIFACNLDGLALLQSGSANVEAKTTGLANEWGEPWTDQVPYRVNLQAHQQMLCTDLDVSYIVVLLGKYGLKEEIYVVKRNERIINAIIARGEQWWNAYVVTKTPPPETEPCNGDIFKRIIREPSSIAEKKVSAKLVKMWESAKEEENAAKKKKEALFNRILKKMGDNEAIMITDKRVLTYMEQRQADKIDRNKLRNQYAAVYSDVATPATRRVPYVK